MCGVIGAHLKWATDSSLDALRTILLESSIRGRHSSGIAWHTGEGIQREVVQGPMEGLLSNLSLDDLVRHDGSLLCVGHARYSTSDLGWPQPLVADGVALVHNGVVSQADPSEWPERWPYRCQGRNDSELLLRAVLAGRSDFSQFLGKASIATVWITADGQALRYLRNGLRPLWTAELGEGLVVASTRDILERAGLAPQRVKSVMMPDLQP